MQIIINKATRTVLHADAALHLDAVCASNGAWVDHSTTTATAELLDVPGTLPPDWAPGAYTYSQAGEFEPVPPEVPVVAPPPPGGMPLPVFMPGGAA